MNIKKEHINLKKEDILTKILVLESYKYISNNLVFKDVTSKLANQLIVRSIEGQAREGHGIFNKYEEHLREYDWEGFPYYPWKPSHAQLVLPLFEGTVPSSLSFLRYDNDPIKKAKEMEEVFKFHIMVLVQNNKDINYLKVDELAYLSNWEAEQKI